MRARLFAAAAVVLGGAAGLQAIEFGGGIADLLAAPAQAAEETAPAEPGAAPDAAEDHAEGDSGGEADGDAAALPPPEGAVSFPEQIGASADEYRILISLQERRRELEQWETGIDTRAQLVAAAEARVEERLAELRAVREEIAGLLGNLDAQEEARVAALVATYEKMDAKDAARILAGLETDTSMLVLARMKNQALADILGEMGTEDARRITEMLAVRANLRAVVGEAAGATETEGGAVGDTAAAATGAADAAAET